MECDFAIAEQVKTQQATAPPEGQQEATAASGGNPPTGGLGVVGAPPPKTGPRGGFDGHSGRAPTAQTLPRLQAKGDGRPYVRESD